MKLERVLEKLEELLKGWGLSRDDWILTAGYATKLQGYPTKLRKGHLNIMLNKDRVWWKTHGMEAFPPPSSREFRQFKRWMKITGFDSDLIPKDSKRLGRIDTVFHTLPNGKNIKLTTLVAQIREIGEFVLPQCTEKGIGIEKGKYMLNIVKEYKKSAQAKEDHKAIKLADKYIKKYAFLEKEEKVPKDYSKTKILKGNCAFRGRVKGLVRVILDENKAGNLEEGEVLVVKMTSAKFTPLIDRAKAIVTNNGGLLCHAAIISREFKIPCIIGTKIATKVLKDGDLVEVDAEKGIVRILEKAK